MKFKPSLFSLNIFHLVLTCFYLFSCTVLKAQVGAIDPSFYQGQGLNNSVRQTIVQPDSTVIVVGDFTFCNQQQVSGVAKLNPDGTTFPGFNTNGVGTNGIVYAVAPMPDGKLLIGGNFTTYNNVSANRVARLNADGSLDTSFHAGSGCSAWVMDILVNPDTTVLLVGNFVTYDGDTVNRIVKLNTDGSRDTSFNAGGGANDGIYAIARQTDGKYVIGGNFTLFNGVAKYRLLRLNTDGNTDGTFSGVGSGPSGGVKDIAVLPNGKIAVSGNFYSYAGGYAVRNFVLLNSNGARNTGFVGGYAFNGIVYRIAIQSDSKIVLSGEFTTYQNVSINRVVRIDTLGARDTTFNPGSGFNGTCYGLALDAGGSVYVSGQFYNVNMYSRLGLARLTSNGSIDHSFLKESKLNDAVSCIGVDANGKVLLGGSFTFYNDYSVNYLCRLTDNGQVDTVFNAGTGPNAALDDIKALANDKILVCGSFTEYDGYTANYIARLNSDGSFDTTFNTGSAFNDRVYELAVDDSARIYAVGRFTQFNGVTANRIVRLHTDGTIDTTFYTGTGFDTTTSTLKIQHDGKLLVGGIFTKYKGTNTTRLVRLSSTGILEGISTFNPSAAGVTVYAIEQQPDNNIIIGGYFNLKLKRLNVNGTVSSGYASLGNALNAYPLDIIYYKGGVLVGGNFTLPLGGYLFADTTGGLDTVTIQTGPISGNQPQLLVRDLFLDETRGRIFVAGDFTALRGAISRSFASCIIPFEDGTIAIDSISIISPSCLGSNTYVRFYRQRYFNSGNTFTVQLSDTNGNYTLPIVIGSENSYGEGWDTISVTMPDTLVPTDGYKVRIVATNAPYTSLSSSAFGIYSLPAPPVPPMPQTACGDSIYTFTWDSVLVGAGGNQIVWSRTHDFDTSYTVNSGDSLLINVEAGEIDTIWVRSKNSITGCVSPDTFTTLHVWPRPIVVEVIRGDTLIREGDSTFLLIPESQPGVLYTLKVNTDVIFSGYGNADTLFIPITSVDTNTYFDLSAEDTLSLCKKWITSLFVQIAGPLTANVGVTHIYCGSSTGEANVSVTGGIPPYKYKWSTGDSTSITSNLQPGLNTLTVTDNTGDSIVTSVEGAYYVTWDTLEYFEQDTLMGINSISPGPGGKNLAQALNTLPAGVDGWIEWQISPEDTFHGFLGIGDNSYSDETTHGAGVAFLDSMIAFTSDNFYTPTIPYIVGNGYKVKVHLVTDSIRAVFTNLTDTSSFFDSTFYYPRSEHFIPGIASFGPGNRVASFLTSFGCSKVKANFIVSPASSSNGKGSVYTTVKGGTLPYSYHWSNGNVTAHLIDVPVGYYTVTITDAASDTLIKQAFLGTYVRWQHLLNAHEDSLHRLLIDSAVVNFNSDEETFPGFAVGYNELQIDSDGTIEFEFLPGGSFTGAIGLFDKSSNFFEGGAGSGSVILMLPGTSDIGAGEMSNGLYIVGADGEMAYLGNYLSASSMKLSIINSGDSTTFVKNDIGSYTREYEQTTPLHPVVVGFNSNKVVQRITSSFGVPLQVKDLATPSTCYEAEGSAIAVPVGENPPYSFVWSTSDTTQGIYDVSAGTYNVTVTDSLGSNTTAAIQVPYRVEVDTSQNAEVDSTGSLLFHKTGDAFLESYAVGINTLRPEEDGWVEFEIQPGMSFEGHLLLTNNLYEDETTRGIGALLQDDLLEVQAYPDTNPDELAKFPLRAGLKLRVSVSGDVFSVTASYGGGAFSVSDTLLIHRDFDLTPSIIALSDSSVVNSVVSSFSCSRLRLSASVTPAEDYYSTGIIHTTVKGGVPPYSYHWSNGDTTPNISAAPFGYYALTVTDTYSDTILASVFLGTYVNWDAMYHINEDTNKSLYSDREWLSEYDGTELMNNAALGLNELKWDSSGCISVDFYDSVGFSGFVGFTSMPLRRMNGFLVVNEASSVPLAPGVYAYGEEIAYLGQLNTHASLNLKVCNIRDTLFFIKNDISTIQVVHYEFEQQPVVPMVLAFNEGKLIDRITCNFSSPIKVNAAVQHTSCGLNNGGVEIIAKGGLPPYSYTWSTADTTAYIANQEPGLYSCTVVDALGDTAIQSFDIGFSVTWDSLLRFYEDSLGRLVSTETGAEQYQSYAVGLNTIKPGAEGWLEFEIAAGDTFMGIMGASNNLLFDETNKGFGAFLTATGDVYVYSDESDPVYFGRNEIQQGFRIRYDIKDTAVNITKWYAIGEILMQSGEYEVSLPYNITEDMFPGTFSATQGSRLKSIRTSYNCDVLRAEIISHYSASVFSDGVIAVKNVRGGTAPYSYLWSTADTGSLINAPVGNYQVTITDANGDSVVLKTFLGAPITWDILKHVDVLDTVGIVCMESAPLYGEEYLIPNYGFGLNVLNPDDTGTLSAGINVPGAFIGTINLGSDIASSYGEIPLDGYALMVLPGVSGKSEIYAASVHFDPIFMGYTRDSIPVNLKIIKHTNSVEFVKNDVVGVIVPATFEHRLYAGISPMVEGAKADQIVCDFRPGLRIASTITHLSCGSSDSGSISLTVKGGQPPYSYYWSNSDTLPNIDVYAGDYSVTVKDVFGDSALAFVSVGYKVSWDTLVGFTVDSVGLLQNVDSLDDSYSIADNVLFADSTGWLQFSILQSDTFNGLLTLSDSRLISPSSNTAGFYIYENEIYAVATGMEDVYFGHYEQGLSYVFSIRLTQDSLVFLKANSLDDRFREVSYSWPRYFCLKPIIVSDKQDSKVCVVASFGCDAIYDSVLSIGNIVSSSDTLCSGNSVVITLDSHVGPLVWQRRFVNEPWQNLGDQYDDVDTVYLDSLTNSAYYRAVVVSNTCSDRSSNVIAVIVTTERPAEPNRISVSEYLCAEGDTLKIKAWPVEADGMSYLWQYSVNGTSYSLLEESSNDTVNVTTPEAMDYFYRRIMIHPKLCPRISNTVKLNR